MRKNVRTFRIFVRKGRPTVRPREHWTFRHFSVSAVGKCVGDNFGVLLPVLTFRYNFNPFGVKFDRFI